MYFFEAIKKHLPNSPITPEASLYARASIGALAACSAAIHPAAGALILLAHGALEYTTFFTKVDPEQQRKNTYDKAFSRLHLNAEALGTECHRDEIDKAKNIFFVHNLIEEICYKTFADVVTEFGIQSDDITEEMSALILERVKRITHIELRKDGGYSKKGKEMITAQQFIKVINNVNTIIHDRDIRLTDARYSTLTDLCIALDDHNSFVKNILLNSWLRCESLCCDTHITMIKDLVDFNKRMTKQLGFDFENALKNKRAYYDAWHSNITTVVSPATGERSASRYTNVTAVRAAFKAHTDQLQHYHPEMLLADCLTEYFDFTDTEVQALQSERSVTSPSRFGKNSPIKIARAPLLKKGLTVGEFLQYYFPEISDPTNKGILAGNGVFHTSSKRMPNENKPDQTVTFSEKTNNYVNSTPF